MQKRRSRRRKVCLQQKNANRVNATEGEYYKEYYNDSYKSLWSSDHDFALSSDVDLEIDEYKANTIIDICRTEDCENGEKFMTTV